MHKIFFLALIKAKGKKTTQETNKQQQTNTPTHLEGKKKTKKKIPQTKGTKNKVYCLLFPLKSLWARFKGLRLKR